MEELYSLFLTVMSETMVNVGSFLRLNRVEVGTRNYCVLKTLSHTIVPDSFEVSEHQSNLGCKGVLLTSTTLTVVVDLPTATDANFDVIRTQLAISTADAAYPAGVPVSSGLLVEVIFDNDAPTENYTGTEWILERCIHRL